MENRLVIPVTHYLKRSKMIEKILNIVGSTFTVLSFDNDTVCLKNECYSESFIITYIGVVDGLVIEAHTPMVAIEAYDKLKGMV